MAHYPQITRSPEAGLKDLYLEVPITNTSGNPGTPVRRQGFGLVNGLGTSPIVRSSAGVYTLNLDQRWQGCVEVDVVMADGTVTSTDGYNLFRVVRQLNQAQPAIVINLSNAAGALADPFATSGAGSMIVHLTLKDSTV